MQVPASDLPANLVPQDDLPTSPTQVPSTSNEVPQDDLPGGAQPAPRNTVPNPIATPHTYDSAITSASSTYGIDPRVLQAVGMQESRLGTGAGYNANTGRDAGGNLGVSPFQLDPASGLSKDTLARAAQDPSYAARLSAQMLQRNLKASNGNLREALSMYNSGSRHSSQGLAYADSVLSFMNQDQPLIQHQDLITKLKHDSAQVQRKLSRGVPLDKALAHTSTLKPLHRLEVRGSNAWDWVRHHPFTEAMDILGAPQRAVGGALHEVANQHGPETVEAFKQQLHHVWDYVFNPTEHNQEKTTSGLGEVVNRIAGHRVVPSHTDIDNYVHRQTRIPSAIRPYVAGIARAGVDFTQQTLTDPMMIDGVGRGLIHLGSHVPSAVAHAALATARTMGIAQHFPHLPMVHQAAEAARDLFGVRRDLTRAGFTSKGHKVRLAIENAELNRAESDFAADRAASHSAEESAQRILGYVHQHGNAHKSSLAAEALGVSPHASPTGHIAVANMPNMLEKIHGMNPQEREAFLIKVRKQIAKKEVNRQTKAIISKHPDLYTGGQRELDKLDLQDNSPIFKALKGVEKNNPLASLADLGKKAILWNPMPHGLVNVGTLAYQAGGIPAVMRGFAHMTGKTNQPLLNRLRDMGALSEYSNTAKTTIGKKSNEILHKMEYGWRAGLLEQLDKKLGPSAPGSVEEFLKGHMISNHVGDYRNQSAFVHMFKALGGPFVAFRLGIVPQQFLRTMKEKPSRIINQIRGNQDIQNNRQGKRKNELIQGGPTEDMLKLLTDPRAFFASPSTSGVLGEFLSSSSSLHGGLLERGIDLAKAYIPGASDISKLGEVMQGSTMPEQKMSIVDKLMGAVESEFLNMYYKKKETTKQVKASKGRIRRDVTI